MEADREELRRQYDQLMRMRAGETAGDADARRALFHPFSLPARLETLRRRTVAANTHLISHNIDRDDRVVLMRAVLPDWASFLAAEVAYERPAEEKQIWFRMASLDKWDADA